MTHCFKWDEAKTASLIDLHNAGIDRAEIARALNIEYVRVKSRMIYLGLTEGRKPIGQGDIDLGQKMHELARLRFSIDECAYALGITLPKAFALAEWYCVRFDELPVDTATVKAMLAQNRSHADIAKAFGCSHQKIAAMAKAIRERGVSA
jgi:hypothetical protein